MKPFYFTSTTFKTHSKRTKPSIPKFDLNSNNESSSLDNKNKSVISNNQKQTISELQQKIDELTLELTEQEQQFTKNLKTINKQLNEKNIVISNLELQIEQLKQQHVSEMEEFKTSLLLKFNKSLNAHNRETEILKNEINEMKEKAQLKKIKKHNLKEKCNKLENDYNDIYDKLTSILNDKVEDSIEENAKQLINELKERVINQNKMIMELKDEVGFVNVENKKLKNLTKTIIEQRNETEIFFLDALDEVKKEMFMKRKEREKRGCFFPTLKKNYESYNIKVDIKSLEPEVREKILRNLFTKINETYNPDKFKQLNDIMAIDIENEEI